MNRFRFLAFAAVMAASLPGMAQHGEKKVCVVTGELNGWPANRVVIARYGEDERFWTLHLRAGGRRKHLV